MEELLDQALLKRFVEKDESAFDELVLRYRNSTYNLVLSVVADMELAWETTQGIFIAVYQELKKNRLKCSVAVLIYRVAVDYAVSLFGKRKKAGIFSGDERGWIKEVNGDEAITVSTPLHLMKEEIFNEGFERLSRMQKLVIILRHFGSLSFEEMSEVLEQKTDYLKVVHYRAIKVLRKACER
ncbi:MAG: hypothetical protein HYS07_11335 [Chlamydiae bacterium]|nr:hypothetical protein [Chlamydiota bacterium]MBI3278079.1 hypothetical protein [Chlamydiota bacterium]